LQVELGPAEDLSITDHEKMPKLFFLKPLADKDRLAHKLGPLNQKMVQSVLSYIADGLGFELIDSFECGLLQNKLTEYLETSLDGWLVLQPKGDTVLSESEDDEEEDRCIPYH